MAHEAEQFHSGEGLKVEVRPELAGVVDAVHEHDDVRELRDNITPHGGRVEGDVGHLHVDAGKPQVEFVQHNGGILDRFRGISSANPFIAEQEKRKGEMKIH